MSIHQIDRSTFLIEFPGLRRSAEDVSLLAEGCVPDRAFGAELRRLLYAAMESTAEAAWVREHGHAVTIAPTEPHCGKFVFRMTFKDEDAAMMFATRWGACEVGTTCSRPQAA